MPSSPSSCTSQSTLHPFPTLLYELASVPKDIKSPHLSGIRGERNKKKSETDVFNGELMRCRRDRTADKRLP